MQRKALMTAWALVVGSLFYALLAQAEDAEGKHDAVLQKIESELKPFFIREKIEPTFSWDDDKLTAKYEARTYLVHGSLMNGEFTKDAKEEIGPRNRGFILEIERRHGSPAELHAVVPQKVHHPYWQAYINTPGVPAIAVAGKAKPDHYYFLQLSYGAGLNEQLRNAIQKIVENTISAEAK